MTLFQLTWKIYGEKALAISLQFRGNSSNTHLLLDLPQTDSVNSFHFRQRPRLKGILHKQNWKKIEMKSFTPHRLMFAFLFN